MDPNQLASAVNTVLNVGSLLSFAVLCVLSSLLQSSRWGKRELVALLLL